MQTSLSSLQRRQPQPSLRPLVHSLLETKPIEIAQDDGKARSFLDKSTA
jgi:hypothetical protein